MSRELGAEFIGTFALVTAVCGAALYLLSDLSTGVTGEIHFVDSGYNIIAMPHPDVLKGLVPDPGAA